MAITVNAPRMFDCLNQIDSLNNVVESNTNMDYNILHQLIPQEGMCTNCINVDVTASELAFS